MDKQLEAIKERVDKMKKEANKEFTADILAIEIAFQDTPALVDEVERLQQFEQKAIYVIEENKRLREALEFYADEENYYRSYTEDFSKVHNEGGKIARQVLEEK